MIDRALKKDPIETNDANDPIEPTEKAELIEPMLMKEFFEPMLKAEFFEAKLHRELLGICPSVMPLLLREVSDVIMPQASAPECPTVIGVISPMRQ